MPCIEPRTSRTSVRNPAPHLSLTRLASLVGVLLFGVMAWAVIDDYRDTKVDISLPTTTAQVSDSIFSTYLIPFEVVSVLLLAALIGAIVVARKD